MQQGPGATSSMLYGPSLALETEGWDVSMGRAAGWTEAYKTGSSLAAGGRKTTYLPTWYRDIRPFRSSLQARARKLKVRWMYIYLVMVHGGEIARISVTERNALCVDYRCTTVPKVWTGIPGVDSHFVSRCCTVQYCTYLPTYLPIYLASTAGVNDG